MAAEKTLEAAVAQSESNHYKSEIQRRIAELWKDALGLSDVGIDDSFADLGGDSFTAIRLTTELELCLRRPIPVDVLLRADTIRKLSTFLETNHRPVYTLALGPVAKQSFRQSPLFCVYGLFLYKHLAAALGSRIPTYGIYVEAETRAREPQTSPRRSTSIEDVERPRGVPPDRWTNGMLGFPQPEENQDEEGSVYGRADRCDFAGC